MRVGEGEARPATCGAVALAVLHRVAPGDGHVVHDPVVLVVHEHPLLQQRELLLVLGLGGLVGLGAEHRAGGLRLAEGNRIGRGPDSLPEHHLGGEVRWGGVRWNGARGDGVRWGGVR